MEYLPLLDKSQINALITLSNAHRDIVHLYVWYRQSVRDTIIPRINIVKGACLKQPTLHHSHQSYGFILLWILQ